MTRLCKEIFLFDFWPPALKSTWWLSFSLPMRLLSDVFQMRASHYKPTVWLLYLDKDLSHTYCRYSHLFAILHTKNSTCTRTNHQNVSKHVFTAAQSGTNCLCCAIDYCICRNVSFARTMVECYQGKAVWHKKRERLPFMISSSWPQIKVAGLVVFLPHTAGKAWNSF